MKTQTEKKLSGKSNAVAHSASGKQEKEEVDIQFRDRRAETVTQSMLQGTAGNSPQAGKVAQMQAMANGSAIGTVQREAGEEEEKAELMSRTVQKQGSEAGDEEGAQLNSATFRKLGSEGNGMQTNRSDAQQNDAKSPNKTGLPDILKSGIENLSGLSLDDVKVHYNSPKPAQLQAHAFAQGTDIHMAPGQEKHLLHEAWHVVQQKQGRVQPTKQLKGKVNVNDDAGLEKEADVMGARAASVATHVVRHDKVLKSTQVKTSDQLHKFSSSHTSVPIQRADSLDELLKNSESGKRPQVDLNNKPTREIENNEVAEENQDSLTEFVKERAGVKPEPKSEENAEEHDWAGGNFNLGEDQAELKQRPARKRGTPPKYQTRRSIAKHAEKEAKKERALQPGPVRLTRRDSDVSGFADAMSPDKRKEAFKGAKKELVPKTMRDKVQKAGEDVSATAGAAAGFLPVIGPFIEATLEGAGAASKIDRSDRMAANPDVRQQLGGKLLDQEAQRQGASAVGRAMGGATMLPGASTVGAMGAAAAFDHFNPSKDEKKEAENLLITQKAISDERKSEGQKIEEDK